LKQAVGKFIKLDLGKANSLWVEIVLKPSQYL